MRMRQKLTFVFCVLITSKAFSEEETGTLIKWVSPKQGIEVTSLLSDGEDIITGFGDGSALRFNKNLDSQKEIAKTGSAITAMALSKDKKYLGISTSGHGTTRYERETSYYSSAYKQTNIRFGAATPYNSIAFDPLAGAYLITIDDKARGSIFLSEDGKGTNETGNGNLIGPVFTDGTKVRGVLPLRDGMLYALPGRIAFYNYTWNLPSPESDKKEIKAEKGPELKDTGTEIVSETVYSMALNPSEDILFYIKRSEEGKNSLYKYEFSDKKTTLLYTTEQKINGIAVPDYDGMDIYLAIGDTITVIRNESIMINVDNKTDVYTQLYINQNYMKSIPPRTKIEMILKPGSFSPSVKSSSANVFFENFDGRTVNLRNKESLDLSINRSYPIRLSPVTDKTLKINDAGINTAQGARVLKTVNAQSEILLVLNANHKLRYKLHFNGPIQFVIGTCLFVAEQNRVYAHNIISGKQEHSWETKVEEIKALTAFGNKLLVLGPHAVEITDIATKTCLYFPNNKGINITACLPDNETFILGKTDAVETYKFDHEKAELVHRIPASWIGGVVRNIIPGAENTFSILTEGNLLCAFNDNPDQIEPLAVYQFDQALQYQYSYQKEGLIYIRFLNKKVNRVQDYDLELPNYISGSFYIDSEIKSIYGDGGTILGISEKYLIQYANSDSVIGRYFIFDNFTSVFIKPGGNDKTNDTYYPGSVEFNPLEYLKVRQHTNNRDFISRDIAETNGG